MYIHCLVFYRRSCIRENVYILANIVVILKEIINIEVQTYRCLHVVRQHVLGINLNMYTCSDFCAPLNMPHTLIKDIRALVRPPTYNKI